MLLRGKGRLERIDSSSGSNVVKRHYDFDTVITDGRTIYVESKEMSAWVSVPAGRYAIHWSEQPAIEEHTELSLSGLVSPVPEKTELEDEVDTDAGGPDFSRVDVLVSGRLTAALRDFVQLIHAFVDLWPQQAEDANARAWLWELDIRKLNESEQARVELARKLDAQAETKLFPSIEGSKWQGMPKLRLALGHIREVLAEIEERRGGN